MRSLSKLFAVAILSGTAAVGSVHAQYPSFRPTLPAPQPPLTLTPGVRPVPTTPPNVLTVAPGILPGGCFPTKPYPNPGPFPPPAIDIDYKVFYRTSPCDRWRYYATADSGREARRIERYLEAQGYQVNLVEKFDRTPDR